METEVNLAASLSEHCGRVCTKWSGNGQESERARSPRRCITAAV
jgi:hypothetical protein